MFIGKRKYIASAILSLTVALDAQAGIELSATRLIFEQKKNEASVTVKNSGGQEILLQSWIESNDEDSHEPPFIVTPPLAKLDDNGRQVLRVLYRGTGMPDDKESVVWLNTQEIPQASDQENTLQLAVRQRIKLFYRPAGLTSTVTDAPGLLAWQLVKEAGQVALHITNPGQYHVSMLGISLGEGAHTESIDGTMVNPGQTLVIPIKNNTMTAQSKLSFYSINDWGGRIAYRGVVSFNNASSAAIEK